MTNLDDKSKKARDQPDPTHQQRRIPYHAYSDIVDASEEAAQCRWRRVYPNEGTENDAPSNPLPTETERSSKENKERRRRDERKRNRVTGSRTRSVCDNTTL